MSFPAYFAGDCKAMGKSRSKRSPPAAYLIPSPHQECLRLSSAFEDFSSVDVSLSQPNSDASLSGFSPKSAMASPPPTLTDILLDVSAPPYTLSAFMAFLSQNHCMETLEFTLDTQRYATFYNQPSYDGPGRVSSLWEKLMQTYVTPGAMRELNIPSRVRDNLLRLPSRPTPPPPSALDEAGRIIFELMNDSLLLPFFQSVCPAPVQSVGPDGMRSRHLTTKISRGRHTMPPLTTSMSAGYSMAYDSEDLTDDSDRNSPPPMELMTPPTTPPGSELSYTTSAGVRHAMAAHNKGWKKVGAKLGLSRKSATRQSVPTSAVDSGAYPGSF